MDLFSFPEEIGPGLAVFHPKGAAVINAMEDYSREMHRKHHYSFVQTPHITKGGLYETSGHLHWYKDGMYRRCTWTRSTTPTATSPSRAPTTT